MSTMNKLQTDIESQILSILEKQNPIEYRWG